MYGRGTPGSGHRSASCSWPLPEICLHHERDDVDDDGDDDGDDENDDGDECEVDNCFKDSDEKPDGGDPPCPHPHSSHLTHLCLYANCQNVCEVVLFFKCSNILLFFKYLRYHAVLFVLPQNDELCYSKYLLCFGKTKRTALF